jgi:hypothetical protein
MPMGMARCRPKPPNEEEAAKKQTVETTDMTLGFESPLPLIFARLFAQSGTAAAAWSGMWYGLAVGAMNAATRSTAQTGAPEPERPPERLPERREIAAAGRPRRPRRAGRARGAGPIRQAGGPQGRVVAAVNGAGSRCWRG